jgi:hypothetical protein
MVRCLYRDKVIEKIASEVVIGNLRFFCDKVAVLVVWRHEL